MKGADLQLIVTWIRRPGVNIQNSHPLTSDWSFRERESDCSMLKSITKCKQQVVKI